MDFTRAVRGDDHDRRVLGLYGAHFGDGHLIVGEHFKQERLERLVGAIELVDQEHGRARGVGLERLQQRPLDQKALGEDVVRKPVAVDAAGSLGQPDRDHLLGVIPLVDRGRNVEPLVALQPDQPPSER